jgi:hypothetical protein
MREGSVRFLFWTVLCSAVSLGFAFFVAAAACATAGMSGAYSTIGARMEASSASSPVVVAATASSAIL